MKRIVFLEKGTFRVAFRRPNFPHDWVDFEETATLQIVERLGEADIAIVNKLPLRAETLSQLPRLKLIAVAATGVDNIDLSYCRDHGISVSNTRGYAVNSVPEHVLALVLALRRNLPAYRAEVRAGQWQKAKQFCLLDHPIHDLRDSTCGIIGHGSIGQAMAALAGALGMRVLIAERKGASVIRDGRSSFDRVIRQSDVLTLHCPLTPESRNLIGRDEFEQMKPNALLINTARGGLVDETALVEALAENRIAGAGFDVLSREPPVNGNPLLDLNRHNFILTPHIAWSSREAMQRLADQLIDNLEGFVSGKPLNLMS